MAWQQLERDFTAASQDLVMRVPDDGLDYVIVYRLEGTFTATIQAQESSDDGDSFSSVSAFDSGGVGGDATDEDLFIAPLTAGADYAKLRSTAYTSGTARVQAALIPNAG